MMLAAAVLLALSPQGPAVPLGESLRRVLAEEARRARVVASVAPAVCSVMPLNAPGGGSGVIVDPLGFVLTNFHVVARPRRRGPAPRRPDDRERPGRSPAPRYEDPGPDSDASDPAWKVMKLGLPDGELYLADVLGIDPGSDLAVLLLRERPGGGRSYPAVPLGDSDRLLVGETVFAMGNPFLLANDFVPTVTWGIVSGTHRYLPGGANRFLVYPDCVQVDAPVNPGNSGGPLFNERGEVVGINGRISVRDRGRVNVGVGFAISSNQIRNFLGDLMAGRHAEHGTLDLNAWFMTSPDGKRRGVFVQGTFADSVAVAHGVRLGDEITAFNGVRVHAANQLATLVGVLPAGSWVSLGFRPQLAGGGYGRERLVHFRLTRLDTGSSRASARRRIAPAASRRLARVALTREVGRGETTCEGATLVLSGPGGKKILWQRRGDLLRIERDGVVLVRRGPGEGFAMTSGKVRGLTAEEAALLERTLRAHPGLRCGAERRALLDGSLLEGGVLVLGRPAYRFRLPGEDRLETWLYEDGTPAGYALHDPVRKADVEYRFAHAAHAIFAGRARLVVDRRQETGWRIAEWIRAAPEAGRFRRPAR